MSERDQEKRRQGREADKLRKRARKMRDRLIRAHNHEPIQSVANMPPAKKTPWMVDDAGNPWRQVGDLGNN